MGWIQRRRRVEEGWVRYKGRKGIEKGWVGSRGGEGSDKVGLDS